MYTYLCLSELSWIIMYIHTIHIYICIHKSHFELISTKRYLLIKFSICSFICPRHLGTGCVSLINWIFPRVVKFVINQSLNFQSLIFMLYFFFSRIPYTYFNNVMLTLTEWFSADKTNTKYLLKIRIWMKVWMVWLACGARCSRQGIVVFVFFSTASYLHPFWLIIPFMKLVVNNIFDFQLNILIFHSVKFLTLSSWNLNGFMGRWIFEMLVN